MSNHPQPWLESRNSYSPRWERFLPVDGLPFSMQEMYVILDGGTVRRGEGTNYTEFRIERKAEK